MDAAPAMKERAENPDPSIHGRAEKQFLDQFTLDDSNAFITTDAGGPIQDDNSLKAGERGPTLLEDFIFRQKITHFDHERVRHSLS